MRLWVLFGTENDTGHGLYCFDWVLTSGGFGPSADGPIAMAYIRNQLRPIKRL